MRHLLLAVPVFLMATQPVQAARTLAFLGDSLTAGYGVEPGEAYPALIGSRLKSLGLDWKVVNAGISGDTTSGGLARLDWLFRQKIDVLFVCLGANDGMRGVPVAVMEKNLKAIVEQAQAKGARVVLAGVLLPENYGADYRKAFAAVFPKVARQTHATYMPFLLEGVAMDPALNQADRIHPTAQGQRVVADHVWKVLEPVLRKQ